MQTYCTYVKYIGKCYFYHMYLYSLGYFYILLSFFSLWSRVTSALALIILRLIKSLIILWLIESMIIPWLILTNHSPTDQVTNHSLIDWINDRSLIDFHYSFSDWLSLTDSYSTFSDRVSLLILWLVDYVPGHLVSVALIILWLIVTWSVSDCVNDHYLTDNDWLFFAEEISRL